LSAAVRRSFDSLAVPNYRRYFVGQLVSLSGNWAQMVAAVWLILSLTHSGFAVGLTTALQSAGSRKPTTRASRCCSPRWRASPPPGPPAPRLAAWRAPRRRPRSRLATLCELNLDRGSWRQRV